MADETAVAAPPAVEIAEPVEVEHLNDSQRESWIKTGDLPVKAKPEAPPASKPVDAGAAAVEKKAESGTAKKKPDQERNWRTLESERDTFKSRAEALEKELADAKGKAAPADKPAEDKKVADLATPGLPTEPERPKRPRFSEFTDAGKYEEAMDAYEQALPTYQAKKAAFDRAKADFEKQQAVFTERQKKVGETWKAISDKGIELYGKDEWSKIIANSDFPVYQNEPVEVWLRETGATDPEMGAHMAQYFSLKREDLQRIVQLPAKQQYRELQALEAAMEEELSGNKPAAVPPKKEVTAAKKPPHEVGGKAAGSPADEAEAALKRNDIDAYMEIMNKRDVAKRKIGR